MPFARLTLNPALTSEAARALAQGLTALIAEALAKEASLTAVLVESPTGLWTIAATPRSQAAHLEVRVTAGTNSPAQKADFIARAQALLRAALPGLAPASYVCVLESPATDWGYDGQTQAARAQKRSGGSTEAP